LFEPLRFIGLVEFCPVLAPRASRTRNQARAAKKKEPDRPGSSMALIPVPTFASS